MSELPDFSWESSQSVAAQSVAERGRHKIMSDVEDSEDADSGRSGNVHDQMISFMIR